MKYGWSTLIVGMNVVEDSDVVGGELRTRERRGHLKE